jgi:hypothetical protein
MQTKAIDIHNSSKTIAWNSLHVVMFKHHDDFVKQWLDLHIQLQFHRRRNSHTSFMCTLILILLSTYVQYQPYTPSPIRYFETSALIYHNSSNTVASKLQTMASNQDRAFGGRAFLAHVCGCGFGFAPGGSIGQPPRGICLSVCLSVCPDTFLHGK